MRDAARRTQASRTGKGLCAESGAGVDRCLLLGCVCVCRLRVGPAMRRRRLALAYLHYSACLMFFLSVPLPLILRMCVRFLLCLRISLALLSLEPSDAGYNYGSAFTLPMPACLDLPACLLAPMPARAGVRCVWVAGSGGLLAR